MGMEWITVLMKNAMLNVKMLPSQEEPIVDQEGLWHAEEQGVKDVCGLRERV